MGSLIRLAVFQGGVGKTMLTSAVVRDNRVRSAFRVICWLNISQQPEIMPLQERLYVQLSKDTESMPKKAKSSVEMQLAALKKAAKSKHVLVVLDDIVSLYTCVCVCGNLSKFSRD